MRKLVCLGCVALVLSGCSSTPLSQPKRNDGVVFMESTTEPSSPVATDSVVVFNTDVIESTFPVPVFDTYRFDTSWGAVILADSDTPLEFHEVGSLEELKGAGNLNIFHDIDGYVRSLFDSGIDFTAYGISSKEQSAFLRGKNSAIVRYLDGDYTIYAAMYAYADDVTVVAVHNTPMRDFSIGYNGQVLTLSGQSTKLKFEEAEMTESTEAAESLGSTEGVECFTEENSLVVTSSSGEVYTFDLSVDNYEVTIEEAGMVSVHNMDSDIWLSIQAFSDVYEGDSEPLVKFKAGYTLYEIKEGQYVLAGRGNTPWLTIQGDDYGVVEEYCRGLLD